MIHLKKIVLSNKWLYFIKEKNLVKKKNLKLRVYLILLPLVKKLIIIIKIKRMHLIIIIRNIKNKKKINGLIIKTFLLALY